MGDNYILVVRDIDRLDFELDALRFKCERLFACDFDVYRPLPYVEHTGYTETVHDEISFVVGSQGASGNSLLEVDSFIEQWQLGDLLNKRVLELSGGWRKFLGIALFTNKASRHKLYHDVTSHLADARLALLLENLGKGAATALFCEYDPALLAAVYPHFGFLCDAGDRLEYTTGVPVSG